MQEKTLNNKYHRKIKALSIVTMIACSFSAFSEEEKVLNIYNWSDYIAEDTIANFEAETGIKVTYDVFDSNEVLEAKMLTGATGYDLVVPTGDFLERQITAGVFQKLDKSKLSNIANIDAEIMAAAEGHDPGNEHALNYMWGTTGFGYNVEKIKERMPDAPVDSWAMIFDPEVVSKFADCGVSVLDAPTELYQNALAYLGLDTESASQEALDQVETLLKSIHPYIKYYHSSQYINDLSNGEVCLSLGWSGDVLQARDRADEADQGVEISYVIPKEGAMIWFDMIAIPSDAPHPENAHLFLDYILKADVMADITNYVYYANGNSASFDLVDDEIKSDPGIYPPAEVKKKLFPAKAYDQRFTRKLTRVWTTLKTGQ